MHSVASVPVIVFMPPARPAERKAKPPRKANDEVNGREGAASDIKTAYVAAHAAHVLRRPHLSAKYAHGIRKTPLPRARKTNKLLALASSMPLSIAKRTMWTTGTHEPRLPNRQHIPIRRTRRSRATVSMLILLSLLLSLLLLSAGFDGTGSSNSPPTPLNTRIKHAMSKKTLGRPIA